VQPTAATLAAVEKDEMFLFIRRSNSSAAIAAIAAGVHAKNQKRARGLVNSKIDKIQLLILLLLS
jgi:hypothetical protein